MLIGRIEGANVDLGKPVDWDQSKGVHCASLPAKVVQDSAGHRVFCSAWFPTPGELELLKQGRPVYLYVWGGGHPPVALSVEGA